MLFDVRTYRCRPGTIAAQLRLYEKHGWDVQCKHLGAPLLHGQVETGDINSFMHIWVYDNAADREVRRKALFADPDWLAYLKLHAEAGYLLSQENTLLNPSSFFNVDARCSQ